MKECNVSIQDIGVLDEQVPVHLPEREMGRSRRHVNWRTLIGLGISLCLLVFLVRGIRWHEFGTSLRQANFWLLLPAALVLIGVTILQSIRWRLLVGSATIGLREAFAILAIGTLGNNVLPARGGDVARMVLLSRQARVRVSYGLASLILEKLLDVLALLVLAAFAVFVIAVPQWFATLLVLASVIAVLGVAICFLIERRDFVSVPSTLRAIVPQRLLARIDGLLHSFHDGLHILGSARNCAAVTVMSLAIWFAMALEAALVIAALHIRGTTIADMLVVMTIINLGLIVPSSPGALGTYEFFGVSALALFNVQHAAALEFTLVMHAIAVFVQVALGVFGLAQIGVSLKNASQLR